MNLVQGRRVEGRGRGHPRIDAIERVTGRAKYVADWRVPGMLYGSIITSGVPHGVVKRVNSSAALKIDGVEGIITCFDDRTVWHAGEREHERFVFTDIVRFIGDCVGAVAAKTRIIAREAAEAVEVEYEELPAVTTVEEAMKDGAPKIWESGNIIGPLTYGFGDTEETFKEADLIVEAQYKTSRVHNAPLEPAGSLAWWDGDKLTVVAATQGIFGCREGLSRDLSLPIEKVRVITYYKGGGFGNKNSSMSYDVVAALLSRKTRRPVLVEYTRMQDFIAVHGRWSSSQNLRAAVRKADGKLLAMELNAFCDVGAYTRHIKTRRFVEGPETYYSCDAWRGEVYGVYTNTPATAHMRAPTGPHSCFAAESLTDEVAHRLGVNPLEFRLRNAVQMYHAKEQFTSNGLKDCLNMGSAAIEWNGRWHPPPIKKPTGRVRGLGVAIATWHADLGRGEAVVRADRDGSFEVQAGIVDIGTGAKSTMLMIAAETLGIPLEMGRITWGDTEKSPYSVGESGSRTTTFTGYAVREAARRVKERILVIASHQLGQPMDKLELKDGRVFAPGTEEGFRFKDILMKAGIESVEEKVVTEPTLPENTHRYCFAAHFAEVEVDTETGEVFLNGYVAAHESGRIINRLTAESQVQGGVVMGLGMALSERVRIDITFGSMANPSFLTYRLPNHASIPKIEVIFVEADDPWGPKSLGEIPIVPVPAAVGNAIFNATGIRLRELPFTPARLTEAIDSP